MKKTLFLLLVIIGFSSAAYSQNMRLNLYGNYIFDDKVDNSYSYNTAGYFSGTVKGGFLWGGGLEFRLHDYYGLELLYQRLDTHAPVEYYDNSVVINNLKSADIDLGVNYIMLGGTRTFSANPKVEPYGGFMLGMAIIDAKNPETDNSSSATKFAWGARLGANLWSSGRVGLKLQMQFISVPQGSGGGLYFGTGGAGVGVTTYSSVFQFALGGGLTFKLGQQSHK